MTPEQHIERLETEVSDIKRSLNELLELVKDMNKGLYGDARNNYTGVIKRQSLLEGELRELRAQIEMIKAKNVEQDIAINARRGLKAEALMWLKVLVLSITNALVLWAILKGLVGPDALLKH